MKIVVCIKQVPDTAFARDVAAGEEEFVPVSFPSMEDDGEYVMECRAVLMGYRPWANVGADVAAWGQSEPAVVKNVKLDKAQQDNEVKYFDDVVMGATCIGVTAGHTHAIFSRLRRADLYLSVSRDLRL